MLKLKKEGLLTKKTIFYFSSLAFLVGIFVASFSQSFASINEILYFAGSLASFLFLITQKNKHIKKIALVVVFLLLGIWRYEIAVFVPNQDDISFFVGTNQEISGVIKTDVVKKSNMQSFVLDKIAISGKSYDGLVQVYMSRYPQLEYGKNLELECKLKAPEPIEDFAYDRYLAMKGVYTICSFPKLKNISKEENGVMWRIYNIKNHLRSIIDKNMGEPSAGIAKAMILGDGSLIDSDTREVFSRTGISHIIAISGMHIAIILGIIVFILFKIGLSRVHVFYFSSFLIILFVILIGAPASAVRACLMSGLAMFAVLIGRTNSIDRVLIFSACVMLLINPKLLRDSIGFQLSFAAVLGIIYLNPHITRLLNRQININILKKYKIIDIASVSLAAQIATTPFVAYYFGIISVLGVVANLLVLWSLPVILALLLIALVLSMIYIPVEYIFLLVEILIIYLINIAEFIEKLPFSSILINSILIIFVI